MESAPGSDGSVLERTSSAGNKDSVIYKDDSVKEEDVVANKAEPAEGQGLLGTHEDSPNNTGTAIKTAASREPTPQLRGTKKRLMNKRYDHRNYEAIFQQLQYYPEKE